MINWSRVNILQKIDNPNFIILTTIWDGKSSNTFEGMVISSDSKEYPIGTFSRSWHKNKFELIEKSINLTFLNN